jgi:hypothetical protein
LGQRQGRGAGRAERHLERAERSAQTGAFGVGAQAAQALHGRSVALAPAQAASVRPRAMTKSANGSGSSRV